MNTLSLPQRLGLAKWLTDTLAALRKGELAGQAADEMPPGARLPVMFGGRLAGWASMPQPSRKTPYVSDEKKLLRWAEANYPAKVEAHAEVAVDDALIGFLAEHYPQALRSADRPDPQWTADICQALKDHGYWCDINGNKVTDIPGITRPEPDPPSPRVNLEPDAAEVIGAAWAAGLIPADELLELPAAEGGEQS